MAVASGALAGCSYDDTAVIERIDKVENDLAELKALVNQINTDLRSEGVATFYGAQLQ